MWIGTAAGLYLLNRNTGEYQYIEMEIGITYINTLYQADNGLLYIGTNGMEYLSIILKIRLSNIIFLIILL